MGGRGEGVRAAALPAAAGAAAGEVGGGPVGVAGIARARTGCGAGTDGVGRPPPEVEAPAEEGGRGRQGDAGGGSREAVLLVTGVAGVSAAAFSLQERKGAKPGQARGP